MKKKILVFSSKPPETYINALRLVNARYDCVFAPDDLSPYGGLLLIGGGDVLPAFYGGCTPSAGINIIRDEAELKAVDYFVKRNLPVLGVCRGAQILNVYFGGKLSLVDNHYDYAISQRNIVIRKRFLSEFSVGKFKPQTKMLPARFMRKATTCKQGRHYRGILCGRKRTRSTISPRKNDR